MAEAAAAAARGDYDAALGIWVDARATPAWRAPRPRSAAASSNGWGVERDPDLASKWLMLAAEAGDPLGQRLLGDFLFQRRGRRARPRHRRGAGIARAAKQGDADAQDMLSLDAARRRPSQARLRRGARVGREGRGAGHRRVHDPARPALSQRAGRRARRRRRRRVVAQGRRARTMPTGRRCWAPPTTSAPACRAIPSIALRLADARPRRRAASSPTASTMPCATACTPEQRREAERRAYLPLGDVEAAP